MATEGPTLACGPQGVGSALEPWKGLRSSNSAGATLPSGGPRPGQFRLPRPPSSVTAPSLPFLRLVSALSAPPGCRALPLVRSSASPAPAPCTPLPLPTLLLVPYPRGVPPGPALSPSVPRRGRPAPPPLDVAEAAPAMLARRCSARRPGAGRRRP